MTLKKIDDELFKINQKISLNLLIPKNLNSEKNKFFRSQDYNPQFKYLDLSHLVDYKLDRRKVNSSNEILNNIFLNAVDENNLKIDLFSSIGSKKFVEHSINLYGLPSDELVKNAIKIVESTKRINSSKSKSVSSSEVVSNFQDELIKLGFNWRVIEKEIIANAIVNPAKKKMMVKKGTMFSKRQINSLIAHEIYGHVLRSECGLNQPFKLFSYGLPDYESTEEGLAILNEDLRGTLLKSSLRGYAGRVLAVHYALNGSFRECYDSLSKYFGEYSAWVMTLRAKRGMTDTSKKGAFTKDFLYLKGYYKVRDYALKYGVSSLYYGKVSLEHVEQLNLCLDDNSCGTKIIHPSKIFAKIFKSNVHPFEKLVRR